jgi:hypothetical protein
MALDPITAGIGLLDNFISRFVKDKDLAAKLAMEARSQEFAGELSLLVGQLEINKAEAASSSVFVAGWRPMIGWTCGFALAYNFILYPFLKFAVLVVVMKYPAVMLPEFPVLNTAELMTVLMGMLGLSGMRTFEKLNDVARNK